MSHLAPPLVSASILKTDYDTIGNTCLLILYLIHCIPPKAPIFSQEVNTHQPVANIFWAHNTDPVQLQVGDLRRHPTGEIVGGQLLTRKFESISGRSQYRITPYPVVECLWLPGSPRVNFSAGVDIKDLCMQNPHLTDQRKHSLRNVYRIGSNSVPSYSLQQRQTIWLSKTVGVVSWNSSVWSGYGERVAFPTDNRVLANSTHIGLPVMAVVLDTRAHGAGGVSHSPYQSTHNYKGTVRVVFSNPKVAAMQKLIDVDVTNANPGPVAAEQLFELKTFLLGRKEIWSSGTTFMTVIYFRNVGAAKEPRTVTVSIHCRYNATGDEDHSEQKTNTMVVNIEQGQDYGVGTIEWDQPYNRPGSLDMLYTVSDSHSNGKHVGTYTSQYIAAPQSLDKNVHSFGKNLVAIDLLFPRDAHSETHDSIEFSIEECFENTIFSVAVNGVEVQRNDTFYDRPGALLHLLCPRSKISFTQPSMETINGAKIWCGENPSYAIRVICDASDY